MVGSFTRAGHYHTPRNARNADPTPHKPSLTAPSSVATGNRARYQCETPQIPTTEIRIGSCADRATQPDRMQAELQQQQ